VSPAPEHDCAWRELAEQRARERDAEHQAREQAEAKLAAAMATIAEYERRLFRPSSERMPSVDEELRKKAAAQSAAGATDGSASASTSAESGPEINGATDATDTSGSASPKRKRKRRRSADLPGLRNEDCHWPVTDAMRKCPHCSRIATPFGEGKLTSEWEYMPGYFVRRRHIQEVVSCRCGQYIARSEAPMRLFDRTHYGPGLVAYIIVAKCGDSMPIYRVEKHFRRIGIPIARSTLNDLLHRAATILKPIYLALLARIVNDAHCQADETSFPLHNRPEKAGYVWTFLAGSLVAYVFSGDRSGQTPARVLGGTSGSLVVDGYTGYNEVTDIDGRDRGGCWSHDRRYYFKALPTAPEAREALDMILELFQVERDAKNAGITGTPAHLELRLARSKPVVDRLERWIAEQLPRHLPQGPMGAALRYTTNQWKALTLFLTDPKIPIHNNASEAALRVVALGRANYLFFGNEEAAANISILYSLVGSCEKVGINPLEYLQDVLMRVQTHPNSRIDELLPDRWKPP
jgi:transposase